MQEYVMATVERTGSGDSRFLLEGVDWATYERLRGIEDNLAIEVEVSRGAIGRMKPYAAWGVPEVWLWRRDALRGHELSPSGAHAEREFSLNLPFLRVADLTPFLSRRHGQDKTSRMREFQSRVREKIVQRGTPSTKRRQ